MDCYEFTENKILLSNVTDTQLLAFPNIISSSYTFVAPLILTAKHKRRSVVGNHFSYHTIFTRHSSMYPFRPVYFLFGYKNFHLCTILHVLTLYFFCLLASFKTNLFVFGSIKMCDITECWLAGNKFSNLTSSSNTIHNLSGKVNYVTSSALTLR